MTVFAFDIPMPLFLASILWVLGDLLGIFLPSNIANLAHLSGLFFGLILGFILRKPEIKRERINLKIPETYMQNWEDNFIRYREFHS